MRQSTGVLYAPSVITGIMGIYKGGNYVYFGILLEYNNSHIKDRLNTLYLQ